MANHPGWFVVFALGCGPVVTDGETDAASGDDGGSGDSTGTTSSSTTATTTSAGTTANPTSTTTAEPTGCADNYVSGCQSYCAVAITCNPDEGIYEECVNELCPSELATASVECQQRFCEALTCYGILDCTAFNDGSAECEAMADEADDVCDRGGTSCSVFPDGDVCGYICGGEVERRMQCADGACMCYEDDIPTAECPFEGACTDSAAIEDHASFCCGW